MTRPALRVGVLLLGASLLTTACGSRADFTLATGGDQDGTVVVAEPGSSPGGPSDPTTVDGAPGTPSTSPAGGPAGGSPGTGATAGAPGAQAPRPGGSQVAAGAVDRTPIRLAYVIQGTAGVGAITGNNTQGDSDVAKRNMDALVAHANANGGVGGRRISATGFTSEATSQQPERLALCKSITEDYKAQVVLDANQFLTEEGWACYAQHKVAYLGTVSATDRAFLKKYAPYVSTTWLSVDRSMRAAVQGGDSVGFYRGGKVGVLLADVPTMRRLADSVLRPAFAKVGITDVTYRFITNDSGGGQQAQTNSAVLAFASAGVDRVVFFHNILVWIGFTNQAASQRYQPRYAFSDYQGMTGVAAAYSSTARGQNEGAIAVSSSPSFVLEDSSRNATDTTAPIDRAKASPGQRRCLDVLSQRTGRNYYDPNDSGDTLGTWILYCDEFFAWWEAARAVGAGWTPGRTAQGLTSLGRGYLSTLQHSTDWTGVHDAASSFRVGRFTQECSCFVKAGPWQPI